MLLMIDNYDSFTYNLVQYLAEIGQEVEVVRNDKISIKEINNLNPQYIVISPGPCTPNEAGISLELIEAFKGKIPILGVCLGHQSIGQAFGGKIIHAQTIMHGKTSRISHNNKGVFSGIKNPFIATRYHSLVIDEETIPDCFVISARTEDDGAVMGIKHKKYPLLGVQFHPESILTKAGKKLLGNFLEF